MKDLHVILSDYAEIYIRELCKYCQCKQTDLIEALLTIAYTAAKVQVKLSKEDKEPEDITDVYYTTVITDIFDHLYPPVNVEKLN